METARPIAVRERLTPLSLAVGAVCGCVVLAAVDPNEPGRYPTCPTRALLGLDCPACGTLRGVHALLHGRVGDALDHNLLLLLAVPVAMAAWLGLVLGAAGRRAPNFALPPWAFPAALILAATFAVVRNLPVPSLAWLGSAA